MLHSIYGPFVHATEAMIRPIRRSSADVAWVIVKRLPAVHPLAKLRAWLRGIRGLQVILLPPEHGKPPQVAICLRGAEGALHYVHDGFVHAIEAANRMLRANNVIQTGSTPTDALQTPVFQPDQVGWQTTMSLIDYAHVQPFLRLRLPLPKDLAYKRIKQLVDNGAMDITFAATHARGNSNIMTIALRNAYDLTRRADFQRVPMGSDASYAAILAGYYDHMFNTYGSHPDDWPPKTHTVRILLKGHAVELDPGSWWQPGTFRPLSDVASRVVLCIRDPLLTWNSILDAFVLSDPNQGNPSILREILRGKLHAYDALPQALLEAVIPGDNHAQRALAHGWKACSQRESDSATDLLLDAYAQHRRFSRGWQQLEDYVRKTHDFNAANDIAAYVYPMRRRADRSYATPREMHYRDPFSFLLGALDNMVAFSAIRKRQRQKVVVLETTLLRTNHQFISLVAEAFGIVSEGVQMVGLQRGVRDQALGYQDATSARLVARALGSDEIQRPREPSLTPAQLPEFIRRRRGVFQQSMERYLQIMLDPAAMRFGGGDDVDVLLSIDVERRITDETPAERGCGNSIQERVPLFSYIMARLHYVDYKRRVEILRQIREENPDLEEIFNMIDQHIIAYSNSSTV